MRFFSKLSLHTSNGLGISYGAAESKPRSLLCAGPAGSFMPLLGNGRPELLKQMRVNSLPGTFATGREHAELGCREFGQRQLENLPAPATGHRGIGNGLDAIGRALQ